MNSLFGPTPIRHSVLALVVLIIANLCNPALATNTEAAGLVALPNHVLRLPAGATKISPPQGAATSRISLTIVLARTDEQAFTAFVDGVNDPKSPLYRQFLSQSALTGRFGPTSAGYGSIRSYLLESGLEIAQESNNRLTITVTGTRAQVEKTFHVSLQDYRLGGITFFANRTNPSVPSTIAPLINAITGLSNLARPRPAQSSLGFTCGQTPQQFAFTYDFGALSADGAGQTVGLVEYDNFHSSDVTDWLACAGLPASLATNVSSVAVAGGTTPSGGSGESEVLLDISTVLGMAPGAKVVVFHAPLGSLQTISAANWAQMLNAMIDYNVNIISSSWGACEDQFSPKDLDGIDSVLQTAAGSGISVFQAAGDSGPACAADWNLIGSTNVPNVLGDMPHATAVGGTVLNPPVGASYSGESYWFFQPASGAPVPLGGFGVSSYFPAPSWQVASLPPGTTGRSVPDVSADASTGINLCQADALGDCPVEFVIPSQGVFAAAFFGTSMAAPEWAAGTALINQVCNGPSGLVASWVNSVSIPGFPALHPPSGMTPPFNDFSHVGFGSFDLGNLATARCPGTARAGRVSSYTFSQSPIAASGSLGPSASATSTLTALNASGAPVPLAPVYLSLTPGIGMAGAANALTQGNVGYFGAEPTLFLTDSNGQLAITYTSPSMFRGQGGTDEILAENAPVNSTVSAEDAYTYQTLAYLAFEPNPIGFWQSGSGPQPKTVQVALSALDASYMPIPGIQVQVSFVQSPTLSGSNLRETNSQGGSVSISGSPSTFQTNASGQTKGQIILSYTVPSGTSGQDTVTASVIASNNALGTPVYGVTAPPDTLRFTSRISRS
jgi:hypothetical protein